MVITEGQIIEAVTAELKKSDIVYMFKHDKDFEKKVKEIVTEVLMELFRVLWQHNGIFRGLAR
jgi:hypothetical protein